MEKSTNLPEENKKRAAFKRFSQMSAAGVAVISLSAFADLSAQQLPAKVENDSIKVRPPLLKIMVSDSLENDSIRWNDANYYASYYNYSNYCNYNNNYSNQYSNNYTNYNNSYGDYSNNYSNSNYSNYSNYSGVSLLLTTYKILSNILLSRLTPFAAEILEDH